MFSEGTTYFLGASKSRHNSVTPLRRSETRVSQNLIQTPSPPPPPPFCSCDTVRYRRLSSRFSRRIPHSPSSSRMTSTRIMAAVQIDQLVTSGPPPVTILITGVTGFLGKVVLEDLVRRKNEGSIIYDQLLVLIRPARGKSPQLPMDWKSERRCTSRTGRPPEALLWHLGRTTTRVDVFA